MNEYQYFLKREYGYPMIVVHIAESIVDVETGEPTSNDTRYTIRRGVFLPVAISREIFSPARSGNYPYGDLFDLTKDLILLDKDDLPVNFLINNEDRIIITDLDEEYKITDMVDLRHHEIHCIQCSVGIVDQSERIVS